MRKITNTSVALAVAVASIIALSGCSSSAHRAPGPYRTAWGNEAAAALPAPGVYSPYRGNVGYEYSRRDRALSARTPAPFSALGQWPGAQPPRERPIRFERWEQ